LKHHRADFPGSEVASARRAEVLGKLSLPSTAATARGGYLKNLRHPELVEGPDTLRPWK
jgi:hypothetical protein